MKIKTVIKDHPFLKWSAILFVSYFINETYWDRENFHQVYCERKSETSQGWWGNYYIIRTAPPFIDDYYGNLYLQDEDVGFRGHFGFDSGAAYNDIKMFTFEQSSNGITGMLTMHFKSGNTLGIGNIENACWDGMKKYISDYEIDVKTETINE